MKTYPVLLLPQLITDYLKSQTVKLPNYEPPILPSSIQERLKQSLWIKWIGCGLIGCLAIIVLPSHWQGIAFGLALLALIGLGMGLWGLWQYYKQEEQRQWQDYTKQLRQWQKSQSLLQRYQKRKQRSQLTLRPLQLKQRLEGKILQPTGQSYAQKGVSEPYFLTILQMYFGEITQFGGEFPIPGSKYKYSQDIVLIEPASGLHFDIEIDEPYEGKSKQPHHCIDEAQDRQRNQFFLAGNWIIVRFAEEQVVKYPHACCGYLTDVIATLTGISYHHKKLKKQNLPLVKCWTRNDARRMAAWSHREQYLEQTGIFRQTKKRKPK